MSSAPRLAAVIGHPIGHSLSPLIHRTWAEREGALAFYVPVDGGEDDAAFARIVEGLAKAGFRGANVTIPFKQAAFALADRRTDAADAIGAANMLTFDERGVTADNSDAIGLAAALRQDADLGKVSSALILGAGGAARGVAYAMRTLLSLDAVTISNRTTSRAEEIADRFDLAVADWPAADAVAEADLIVNATSLGMTGAPSLPLDADQLKPGAIVCDIVYTPLQTPFLQEAAARGCVAINGLSMLMHQAVPGYRAWLGDVADVDADLEARLLDALAERDRP